PISQWNHLVPLVGLRIYVGSRSRGTIHLPRGRCEAHAQLIEIDAQARTYYGPDDLNLSQWNRLARQHQRRISLTRGQKSVTGVIVTQHLDLRHEGAAIVAGPARGLPVRYRDRVGDAVERSLACLKQRGSQGHRVRLASNFGPQLEERRYRTQP